ncbi:MAG TPA: C40 family peptidase [Streptosporangiaceae bacterium]|nr:C40 family peptidase [Streptosporangiaceae bacterium]
MKRVLLWIAVPLMLLGCGAVHVGTSTNRGDAPEARASASPGDGAVLTDARQSTRCGASGDCWVAVNVATLWASPSYPRSIDHPALTNPADPRHWAAAMTVAQKLWLVGKLETQALYGNRVKVIGQWVGPDRVRWVKVAVPSQPTNRDTRGYPGWVPARQLTITRPENTGTTAVVRSRAAWLWSAWSGAGVGGSKVMQVSNATRLPVVEATSAYVVVALLGGQQVALRPSDVAVIAAGEYWGATRNRLVNEAEAFQGLQYLWAGTSGFGYDCSGFTYSVYRDYGITLSRDADQQAVHGTPVALSALRPGDLVFYRGSPSGPIGHVAMYVGSGNIIDAPQTGQPVKIEPLSSHSYYAGARSYL